MKQFAQKLHDKAICTDQSYQKLLTDIENNTIDNPIKFLNYCTKAVIIDLKDYPNEPENYLEKIHQKTASLLPELKFTDFQFQIVLDSSVSDPSYESHKVIVSLRCNGKVYRQSSFINASDIGKYPQMEYFGKIDQQEYYQLFNKILADYQSPYRLHEVKANRGNAVDWNRFGIIALTKEQAAMLHDGGVYFTPSYERFTSSLTSERIDTAILAYQNAGLLAHLSAAQIKLAIEKISQQDNQNLNQVLSCFPDVIYGFDTELGNLNDPYAEIIQGLSSISKGVFNPTSITDHFASPSGQKALVSFALQGKTYSKQVEINSDWVDPSFFELIDQAIKENKLNGQFYELYTGGQEAGLIFLTTSQYQYLHTHHLLVFADQWKEEEY